MRGCYKHNLDVTEGNYLVHNNLGNVYYREGRTAKAIYHYCEALRINPDYIEANKNLKKHSGLKVIV